MRVFKTSYTDMKARRREAAKRCVEFWEKSRAEGEGFEPSNACALPVFKTGAVATQPLDNSGTSANGPADLASCLALLAEKSPDLALLVQRWDSLPEAVRAGIVAMVKAASAG